MDGDSTTSTEIRKAYVLQGLQKQTLPRAHCWTPRKLLPRQLLDRERLIVPAGFAWPTCKSELVGIQRSIPKKISTYLSCKHMYGVYLPFHGAWLLH